MVAWHCCLRKKTWLGFLGFFGSGRRRKLEKKIDLKPMGEKIRPCHLFKSYATEAEGSRMVLPSTRSHECVLWVIVRFKHDETLRVVRVKRFLPWFGFEIKNYYQNQEGMCCSQIFADRIMGRIGQR